MTVRRQHAESVNALLLPALVGVFALVFAGFIVAMLGSSLIGLSVITAAAALLPAAVAIDRLLRRRTSNERAVRNTGRTFARIAARTIARIAAGTTANTHTTAQSIRRRDAQSRALLRLRLNAAHICCIARTTPAPLTARAARA